MPNNRTSTQTNSSTLSGVESGWLVNGEAIYDFGDYGDVSN
jgi:hypothetical protein